MYGVPSGIGTLSAERAYSEGTPIYQQKVKPVASFGRRSRVRSLGGVPDISGGGPDEYGSRRWATDWCLRAPGGEAGKGLAKPGFTFC